jgi:GNAT superfamily N-acetyltransferase
LPSIVVRKVEPNELQVLPESICNWTSGFIEVQATRKTFTADTFDPDGCFVAEDKGTIVGCVAVTSLPRKKWMVIRYLSASKALLRADTVEKLLANALEYVEARKPEFLRATTPAVQPYVDTYKSFGFKPLRRDFRISWDLGNFDRPQQSDAEFREVTDESLEEISNLFVETLRPYWDWRTEEQGGEAAVATGFREGVKKGERWIAGSLGKTIIGVTGLIPNYYGTAEARFRGAFVVPKYRGKGYGHVMMSEGLNWARKLGQNRMTVYTFSFLDCFAPGALLYIKSGGKIDSEYLQLQRSV